MSIEISSRTERNLQLAIDLGERLFALVLFATFAARLSQTIDLRPYNLLVILSEGLVVYFIIIRRQAQVVTMRPLDWLAALLGTALPMLFGAGGQVFVPAVIGTSVISAGLLLAIWAKINLRKSFGIAAANRGTVIQGPYRGIRHPMYAGYIMVHTGFLLNNPIQWNVFIYVTATISQIVRILAEERVLTMDPQYADYRRHVRYRLLPGVF